MMKNKQMKQSYERDKNRKQETIVEVKYTEVVIFNLISHTRKTQTQNNNKTKQKPKRKN